MVAIGVDWNDNFFAFISIVEFLWNRPFPNKRIQLLNIFG